jgi:predicted neuraminidase
MSPIVFRGDLFSPWPALGKRVTGDLELVAFTLRGWSRTMMILNCALFITLALSAAVGAASSHGEAVLKSEFIYESDPTPSCHASTIVETQSGLVAAWFGGPYEKHPEVGIWLSRHEGGRWSKPAEVANGVQPGGGRHPTWNPVLFQPASGPLMLFYKVGPNPEQWWGMLMTSKDGGKTWSAPRRLPEGILGPIKNKPVQLGRNGTLLCPTSTEDGGWRIHFERTGDLGKTWRRIGPVKAEGIGAIQPAILRHSGGRLQAIGRTQQERIFSVESADGGNSWGAMSLLDLPNPNSGVDAVTLAGGRHLLVYNHAGRTKGRWDAGREVLNVAVSADGKAWQAALVLEKEPGQEFSYPAVIQTADGLVHITYTWKRKRVRHVVIDPAKLHLRPIIDGVWPK